MKCFSNLLSWLLVLPLPILTSANFLRVPVGQRKCKHSLGTDQLGYRNQLTSWSFSKVSRPSLLAWAYHLCWSNISWNSNEHFTLEGSFFLGFLSHRTSKEFTTIYATSAIQTRLLTQLCIQSAISQPPFHPSTPKIKGPQYILHVHHL